MTTLQPTLSFPSIFYSSHPNKRGWQIVTWLKPVSLGVILFMAWLFFPLWMHRLDPTLGYIDQSIWLLLILSLITFLVVVGLCWWLLKHLWTVMGLPKPAKLFIHFSFLTVCQQFTFLFGLFALLIFAAIGCILAIC